MRGGQRQKGEGENRGEEQKNDRTSYVCKERKREIYEKKCAKYDGKVDNPSISHMSYWRQQGM